MTKLTRIENGLYCFLVTFDPTREIVNVVDLNSLGTSNVPSEVASSSDAQSKGQLETSIVNSDTEEARSVPQEKPSTETTTAQQKDSIELPAVEPTRTREKVVVRSAPPPRREYSPNDLLTRKEAAEYLGVADRTLAIWKCTGRYDLPYVKIGRLVKYKKADLDKFIEYMKHESIAWKKKER